MVDLTAWVRERIGASKLKEGIACVFASHSTAAMVLIEDEAGLRQGPPKTPWRDSSPKALRARSQLGLGGPGNGHSHVRATCPAGQSVTFPLQQWGSGLSAYGNRCCWWSLTIKAGTGTSCCN
ncbi:MAG: YjbQ family protein [Desulfobacterales bacterium]|nr:YjbQ family protein [Desulfobacterales bacterium]